MFCECSVLCALPNLIWEYRQNSYVGMYVDSLFEIVLVSLKFVTQI